MSRLPYEITEAMIQCFGKCFYYKDLVASFLLKSGVSDVLIDNYRNEPKYIWARHQFSGRGANIIFMTGEDIFYILDGRYHLQDALRAKHEKAEQEGRVYYPLSSL